MTRNPLKWHPKREPVLEYQGQRYWIPRDGFGVRRCAMSRVDEEDKVVAHIPTWSGDWQRAALRQIGATDEEITAAIVYARLMGETV